MIIRTQWKPAGGACWRGPCCLMRKPHWPFQNWLCIMLSHQIFIPIGQLTTSTQEIIIAQVIKLAGHMGLQTQLAILLQTQAWPIFWLLPLILAKNTSPITMNVVHHNSLIALLLNRILIQASHIGKLIYGMQLVVRQRQTIKSKE